MSSRLLCGSQLVASEVSVADVFGFMCHRLWTGLTSAGSASQDLETFRIRLSLLMGRDKGTRFAGPRSVIWSFLTLQSYRAGEKTLFFVSHFSPVQACSPVLCVLVLRISRTVSYALRL